MKSFTLTVASTLVVLGTWTASFTNHPNAVSLEVVPEWNGPDYLVTYKCVGDYDKLGNLDMQEDGDYVTVNYGALGRRRGADFKCHVPVSFRGGATR